jgi:hypothetical protein
MCAAVVRWMRDPDGAAALVSLELFPLYNDGGRTVAMPPELAGPFLEQYARASAEYGTSFRQTEERLFLSLGGRGQW